MAKVRSSLDVMEMAMVVVIMIKMMIMIMIMITRYPGDERSGRCQQEQTLSRAIPSLFLQPRATSRASTFAGEFGKDKLSTIF